MPVVFDQNVGLTEAELETGAPLPVMGEPVDLVEFNRAVSLDEVGEHAASAHGGELAGIPDQHHPPALLIG
jgi:hypothetical protein